MAEQPLRYWQTDPRWSGIDYSAPGERTTIGVSGCGPTAMAMVLASWADPGVTPETECAWALAHGYKAPNSGTYYGYFVPAAARYGLRCVRLNRKNLYGDDKSPLHRQVKEALEGGNWVIACMGPGNWTRSGHYVLVWDVRGDTVYVNDPASRKKRRTEGSWSAFRRQVKYYWVVERPEQEERMDIDRLIREMTEEQAYQLMAKANRWLGKQGEAPWSQAEGHWARAREKGIVDGQRPEVPMSRSEVVAVLGRTGVI